MAVEPTAAAAAVAEASGVAGAAADHQEPADCQDLPARCCRACSLAGRFSGNSVILRKKGCVSEIRVRKMVIM